MGYLVPLPVPEPPKQSARQITTHSLALLRGPSPSALTLTPFTLRNREKVSFNTYQVPGG